MRSHRRASAARSVLLMLVVTAGLCATLHSQVNTGRILGTVHDPSGAVVANAQVIVRHATTGAKEETVTNANGVYVFPLLPIGEYDLTVAAPGFATLAQKDIRVISSVTTTVDEELKVGNPVETVSVTVAPNTVDTTASAAGTTRTVEEINQLPLLLNQSQRSSVSFVRTFPGVSWTPGPVDDGSQGINVAAINGAPEGGAGYVVDGSPASVSGHGQLRDDFSPPPEMIEEVSLTSNTSSENAGWNSGVGVALVTKSGTNSLHGTAFEYLRNDALDSKNWFAGKATPNKQNEYGVTIGGPIIKNKTFFFGMYSGYRLRLTPSGVTQTVPTGGMRSGDFSELLGAQIGTDSLGRPIFQGEIYDPSTTRPDGLGGIIRDPFNFGGQLNHIDPARFSSISSFFQDGYPAPTQAGTQLNWTGQSAASPVNSDKFNIKIDQNLNKDQKVSFAYDHWWRNQVFGAPFSPIISGTWLLTDNTWRARASYTWSISPTLLLNVRAAYNRARDRLAQSGPSTTGGQQAGLTGVLNPVTPPVSIQDASGFGPPWGGFIYQPDYLTPVNADLSWTKGLHNFKFGAAFMTNNFVSQVAAPSSGAYNFSRVETGLPGAPAGTGWGYASFLLGEVDSSTLATPVNVKYQSAVWGFYAQDSWRITPRLTVSYGLRWDIFVPAHELQDRISSFDPNVLNPATGTLGALTFWGKGTGRNGLRREGDIYWKEFSPRFGFAYTLNPKTVIRGSYGLSSPAFYGVLGSGQAGLNGWNASVSPASLDNGATPAFNWDQGFPVLPVVPNLDPALVNGSSLSYLNPAHLKPGRTQNISFGLQWEAPGGIVATADYVGSLTHGLTLNNIVQLNQLDPKFLSLGPLLLQSVTSPEAIAAGIPLPYPGFTGSVSQALRPFPQFQNINEISANDGFNEYNSMQVTVQKHTGFGLSFLASYTLSKELTNHSTFNGQGQGNTVIQFTGQRFDFKQLADLDRPQIFQGSAVYELPFGRGKRFASGSGGAIEHLVGGWQLALTQTYMSGTPVAISTSQSLPGGYLAVFADSVEGVPVKSTGCGDFDPRVPAKSHYLNVAAFADPAPFSFGDTRVLGNIRTCGYKNENLSVIKNFSITERVKFSLAFDFDNVFNRHNWIGLNTNIDNPTSFGQFGSLALGLAGSGATAGSGASDPRNILVHAKISF